MKSRLFLILLMILFIGGLSRSHATAYYCDPVGGSMGNNGTSTNSPWASLEWVFLAAKTFNAGDEIFLMNGQHGQPRIATATQTDYVTIKPYPGHTPKIASLRVHAGSYWALDGLTFTTDGSGGTFNKSYMLETQDTVNYVKIENCNFYSAEDSSSWSKADWYAYAKDAVIIRGTQTIFNTNVIKNTYFALQIEEDYAEVKNNLIDNFGADAVRALGSHAVYENNTIRDAYIHDYGVNHDDAIQMYPLLNGSLDPAGVIEDVVFRNNTIYSFADPITQAMIDDDLVGYWMQSLITTDGHAEDMVVENNLIVADHAHGITLFGAVNCRVQNNTVMKTPTPLNPAADSTPWIAFWQGKLGQESTNSIMRNNIASMLTPATHAGGFNIVVENNLEPAESAYTNVFSDYTHFNFTLKPDSAAVNAGVNTDLTATDLAGNPRLSGPLVDCGAYEYQHLSEYELWISGYPSAGTETDMTDNPDNDSLNNLYEWGLGGDPTNSSDIGYVPTLGLVEHLGDTWLEYTYARRNDADSLELSYHVETNTQLTNNTGWSYYHNFLEGAPDSAGSGFTTVSNRVNTADEDAQFMRLVIKCGIVLSSTFQDDEWGIHPPGNAFDSNLSTKWAAEGTEWIQKGFCQPLTIESVDIAFPLGDQRNYYFTIGVSTDGSTFTQVYSGSSGGSSTGLESFDFADTPAKYVRITGSGNSVNNWNNCSEIVIHTLEIP